MLLSFDDFDFQPLWFFMLRPSIYRSILTLAVLTCCLPALARDPVQVTLPDTPDGTLKAIGAAVGEGKLEVLWQAMPASHQADVKKALAEFSKKFDPDLWDQANKIAGKVSKLMTDKADFIVATPFVTKAFQGNSIKPEDLKKYIAGFGGVLAEAQTSVPTLPEVGTLDMEKLLAKIGPRTKEMHDLSARLGLQNPGENFADLYKVDVKVLKSDADNATVELIKADGSKQTVEMVRVEGKWIYKSAADQWKTKMDPILKELESMQFEPEKKKRALVFTGMTNGFLDTFLNAKTQAEFDEAIDDLQQLFQGAVDPQQPTPPKQQQPLP